MSGHHIFICFSSQDEATAQTVIRFLENRGHKCWISSRDVRPGRNYQEAIVEAIQNAKLMIFLFSESSNNTAEVKKELSLASSFDLPVIPLRLSTTKPNGALLYELATRQWIDAFAEFDAALERMVAAVEESLRTAVKAPAAAASERSAELPRSPPSAGRTRPPLMAPGTEEFEAIRALLARHVGPIAKLFVEKAAADASSLDELCEKLANHVRATPDRSAFLRAARARLSLGR
jgi:TIR domain